MSGQPRPFEIDPTDAFAEEAKVREAALRFEGQFVEDPTSQAFDEAFHVLWDFFGPKNEIEHRAALERWLVDPLEEASVRVDYFLNVWRDRATGALAGVRDCFVGIDRSGRYLPGGCCVVLLSHSFVLPAFRRSGVAALIRTAPATLARQQLERQGLSPRSPVLLLAEMDPVVPADEGSIVRLLSYGRAGFGVVPPAILPYCQPDFRILAPGEPPVPVPMFFVVRLVDREPEQVVPVALVHAMIEALALLHMRAAEPTHVRALADLSHEQLAQLQDPDIALLALPKRTSELARLEPLLRSRGLLHYPLPYQTNLPDPALDLSGLLAALTESP